MKKHTGSKRILRAMLLLMLSIILAFSFASCVDEDEVYMKSDVDSFIETLRGEITAKADETQAAIEALKAEYSTKIAELEGKNTAVQAEIDSLTATYNAKVAELEAKDAENASALASLTAKHNSDIAALEADIAANNTAIANAKTELQRKIDTLTANYNAKVASIEGLITELQATDTSNTSRIATLEAQISALLNPTEYTVSFNTDGAGEIASQKVAIGSKATAPTTPTKEGYTFDGWYINGEKWAFEGFVVTKDITLTAKWSLAIGECEITEAQGFEFDRTTSPITLSMTVENATTNIDLKDIIKVGNGCTWRLYSDCDGTIERAAKSITLNTGDNTAYILVFHPDGEQMTKYKVLVHRRSGYVYTIMSEGTVFESAEVAIGTSLNTPENTPTKNYYDFSHFTVNGAAVSFPYTIDKDNIVFEAVFALKKYTIGYNLSDFTQDSTYPKEYTIKDTLTLPSPTRLGFTFDGWYSNSVFSGEPITEITLGSHGNLALYGRWIEEGVYTINFNTNGGASVSQTTTVFDKNMLPLTLDLNPTYKDGCRFDGWYMDEAFTTPAEKITTEGNVTLHAKFSEATEGLEFTLDSNKYTVTGYTGTAKDIVIPDYYDGKPVAALAEAAFKGNSNITSIALPFTLTAIPDNTFNGCQRLKTVHIAKGTESIGESAFYDCLSLTDIYIPDGIKTIGESAFRGCANLKSIDIPDSVTNMGTYTFYECIALEEIKLPDNIGSIGYSTFYGCKALKSITIPDGVTSIGGYAFEYCSSLTSITIPNSVTSIGSSAFSGCSSLTSITIPNSVTSIGSSAFYNCSRLTSITIPNSVTSIGSSAFSGCSSLTSITIPNSVTSIGSYAFYNCSRLTSITIPNSVTSIGSYAFYNCSRLTSITIPNSVTSIGGYAFEYCSSLTSITIPNSVTSIDNSAFSYCWRLTIYAEAVAKPSGWDSKWNDSDSPVVWDYKETYTDSQGVVYGLTNSDTAMVTGFTGTATEITIPETVNGCTVTNIGNYAFYDCSSLTSITIPNSVKSIGEAAFRGCSSLTSITIPNSVTSIGNYAFSGCSSLTSITIPNSVTSIGNYAFSSCFRLTSITIPNSVTSIGYYAFYGCWRLTIYAEAVAKPSGWNSDLNDSDIPVVWDCKACKDNQGVIYALKNDNTAIVTVFTGTATEITIPETVNGCTVTGIGNYAFYRCSSLTTVTFGENSNLKSIGDSAFSGCSSLTSITIPNSVTSIGDSAFSGSYKLIEVVNKSSLNITAGSSKYGDVAYYAKQVITDESESNIIIDGDFIFYNDNGSYYLLGYKGSDTSITLPDNIAGNLYAIYKYAFDGCSSLTSITIPNSVTSIGNYAFYRCSSLTTVTFGENSNLESIGSSAFSGCSSLTNITIPNSVTSIGNYAFYRCSSLTNITIPNSVTSIGSYAFYDCSNLTSITIPNSVTSIGDYAFAYCLSLTSITIPDGVTSIGSYAFYNCSSLTNITIPNSVTSIGSYAFYNCSSLTSITFADTSNWYRTNNSENWSNKTNGTATNLTNASTNATYFTSTYYNYYWYQA